MRKRLFFKIILLVIFSAEVIVSQPHKQSSKNFSTEKKIESLAQKCWNIRSNNPRKSLEYGYIALKLINSSGIDKSKSTVLNYLGVVYRNIGNLDSAYFYYKSALDLARIKNDKLQVAYSLTNLGDYYSKNALYPTALEKLLQAYHIFESLKNKRGIGYTTNYIGEIYLKIKDYSKSKIFLSNSAELRRSNNDFRGYARTLINISSLQEQQNLFDEATKNLHDALNISKQIRYKKGISETYSGLSLISLKKNQIDSAIFYQQKALAIDKEIENKYQEIQDYNNFAKIYLKIKMFDKAKTFLDLSESEAQESKHYAELLEAYRLLTELFVTQNNFKSAFGYQKKFDNLNEKLFGQETSNKISDLQTAFAIEKREKENALLKKDNEFKKTTFGYLVLASTLFLIGIVLLISQNRLQKKSNSLLAELNNSKDKFFSVIAHDLKNPFGAILSYAEFLKGDYDAMDDEERKEIISGIHNAANHVQNLLNDLLTWARTQKGEIGVNKSQINLYDLTEEISNSYQLTAEKKKIKTEINIDKGIIVNADKFILTTIIGNLLNNALKFSFSDNKILIDAKKENDIIKISVADFGVGMDETTVKNIFNLDSKLTTKGTANETGTGLGLKICKEFANIHNGNLFLESKPNKGSKITFTFQSV